MSAINCMTELPRYRQERRRGRYRIAIDKLDQGNVQVSSIHDALAQTVSPDPELTPTGQRAGY
jgi:hypothetical protein